MIRSILRLAFVVLLSVALSGALVTTAQAKPSPDKVKPFPDRIELPDGFQPEGITIGPGATAYLGSLADGDIYAVNLRTGQRTLVSDGPGTPSVGLKIGKQGHLFVAGGPTGTGRVVDLQTGDVKNYQFVVPTDANPAFINDVVLTRDFAWFTNSQAAELYGVPLGPGDAPGDDFVTLPLTGDWVQAPGFNANGIAETPNRQALLVVNTAEAALFRVDPETGEATRVDLGGYELTNCDGLLVQGNTLYVVQNRLNQIAVFKIDADGTSGELLRVLTSDDLDGSVTFDVPTTVARFGNSLYLPNARFGTPEPETLEYWVTRIDRH
jgi:sugar lactone lactonase YvrE